MGAVIFFIGFGMITGVVAQYIFVNFIGIDVSLKVMLITGTIGGLLAYIKETVDADENQNQNNKKPKW